MPTTQEPTEHQFLVDLSKHLVKPGLYFVCQFLMVDLIGPTFINFDFFSSPYNLSTDQKLHPTTTEISDQY